MPSAVTPFQLIVNSVDHAQHLRTYPAQRAGANVHYLSRRIDARRPALKRATYTCAIFIYTFMCWSADLAKSFVCRFWLDFNYPQSLSERIGKGLFVSHARSPLCCTGMWCIFYGHALSHAVWSARPTGIHEPSRYLVANFIRYVCAPLRWESRRRYPFGAVPRFRGEHWRG